MISLNATIVVQVTLFLLLLYALNRIMIQPLHRVVLEREELIARKKAELVVAHRSLEQIEQDYRKRLRRAEAEARTVQGRIHEEASGKAEQVIHTAQEQVTVLRRKVREQVAQELEKARRELKKQAEVLSFEITQKVVGRRV